MNHISVIIPVRIESKEREDNLRFVLSHLLKYSFIYIDIIESDNEQKFYPMGHERLRYRFIMDNQTVFHRTRYLNMLLKGAQHSVVGIWDTDIIIEEEQLKKAIRKIEDGFVMCFPYDGEFRLLNNTESELVRNGAMTPNSSSGHSLMKRPSVGGAFLVDREKYIAAGGENEDFYGWGPEDIERVKRMEILGLPMARIDGPCFHLHHPRISEKGIDQKERLINNQKALLATCSMNQNLSVNDNSITFPILKDSINSDFDLNLIGMNGCMGKIISLYSLYQKTNDDNHRLKGEKLLDDIWESCDTSSPLSYGSGLCGVGVGIEYLIQNQLVEGNADEVLSDIDAIVFNVIDMRRLSGLDIDNGILGLAYYLFHRLHYRKESEECNVLNLKIYVIYLIDWIEETIIQNGIISKFESHEILYILSLLHQLNIINTKIEKLQDFIKTFPV